MGGGGGWWGVDAFPFAGIRPPADPKGPPFVLWRHYILIMKEERAPKKDAMFWS